MVQHAVDINRLIGEFMDLQEAWEIAPADFDWNALEALAREGAHAYNENAGPSFHALTLDGVEHTAFHERFLDFLLQAGFDPFILASAGSATAPLPVIDHADLAEAARSNQSSARMRTSLMALASVRFEPLVNDALAGKRLDASPLYAAFLACTESLPEELVLRIAPELASPRNARVGRKNVNPVEGYLSAAEMAAEEGQRPYG
jgi:hypothetical protein